MRRPRGASQRARTILARQGQQALGVSTIREAAAAHVPDLQLALWVGQRPCSAARGVGTPRHGLGAVIPGKVEIVLGSDRRIHIAINEPRETDDAFLLRPQLVVARAAGPVLTHRRHQRRVLQVLVALATVDCHPLAAVSKAEGLATAAVKTLAMNHRSRVWLLHRDGTDADAIGHRGAQ